MKDIYRFLTLKKVEIIEKTDVQAEGPLYLFWKQFHAKVMGLFTHHEKFEKQLHIHRKK